MFSGRNSMLQFLRAGYITFGDASTNVKGYRQWNPLDHSQRWQPCNDDTFPRSRRAVYFSTHHSVLRLHYVFVVVTRFRISQISENTANLLIEVVTFTLHFQMKEFLRNRAVYSAYHNQPTLNVHSNKQTIEWRLLLN